jgi:Sulfotransferase family
VTKLVYSGGYGHSGSTLLEYLLAASPKVVACGEVASVLRERRRKGKCTCGREVRLCPVWGPLLASTETLDGMTHERLARALLAQDGGAHAVLVDSSKTAWHSAAVPFRLARELGQAFRLVHLVRDPRAVSWSAVKKSGRRGARPLMPLRSASAALGWWVANLACERFGRAYPDRYLRLRYEDLARSPAETTRRLLAEILPGSEWRADAIGASGNRRQLYGNRMWSARLSLAEVKEDAGWTRDMPGVYRALLSALTAPLCRRYLNRWNARAVAALVAGVTRDEEVNHASEVSSATESRRRRAHRQARQDKPEQAQRRIEKHVQVDERETAR